MADDGENVDFKLFRYDPSMAAAVIFILLFLFISVLHLYQMVRTRTWIFIPFVLGGIFQFVGYVARAVSASESPNWTVGAYSASTILLLVAPALYAASIYMMLGRIILVTDGEHHSIIRKRWLTKIFVAGDVMSFLLQGAGGGIMASGTISAMHTGENIIIGGLVIQVLFFGCFIVTSLMWHSRMRKLPTSRIVSKSIPWEMQLYALYAASVLILVRSVFRLIEYGQGNDGYLISHEYFLYIFDSTLMWITMAILAWVHPSEITALLKGGKGLAVRRGVEVYQLH
ncbi:RTA1 like protein-domain-containing protein [Paraphoma chrysanthemicola]|uniref:RTA1 like protein-domain-containing protein n=1 Tax=Paraphoma chrysanthemicola TaxID=798071 RepID=A0A8K0RCD8_9PLEO|nr:RTA1 like protein-domain-containing protein [Paraphoma chrysanthemicola]